MSAAGQTLLEHLVERLRYAKKIDDVCIITSDCAQDDPIYDLSLKMRAPVFRGSELDVIDRYYKAALEFGAETIVRVTADCPIIDPNIVDFAVELAQERQGQFDLITNRYPITFPDGMDVDVIPFASLEQAWRNAGTTHQREHVIPYFWEEGLRVHNFESNKNYFYSHRLTLDYPEDFLIIKSILEALYCRARPFDLRDILDFVAKNPDISEINRMHLPVA